MGFYTQASLSLRMGVRPTVISAIENFKYYPKTYENRRFYEEFFRLPFDEIFPPEFRDVVDKKTKTKITREVQFKGLKGRHGVPELFLPSAEDDFIKKEDTANIRKTIDELLDPKEAKVLRLRFGMFNDEDLADIERLGVRIKVGGEITLAEIGRIMSLSRDRIRQIEMKALRRLKHPSRIRQLLNDKTFNWFEYHKKEGLTW